MISDRQGRSLYGSGSVRRVATPDQKPFAGLLQPPTGPQNARIPENSKFSTSQLKFMSDIIGQQPPQQQQIVGQQLLQLTPDEVAEIQRKLQNGEIIHGFSSLPQGVNPTHKFIVKIRKPYQQKTDHIRAQSPPPQQQPQQFQFVCPDCPYKDHLIHQLEQALENLKLDNAKLQHKAHQQQNKLNQMENHISDLQNQVKNAPDDSEQLESGNMQPNDDGIFEERAKMLKEQLEMKNLEIDSLYRQLKEQRVETRIETKTVYKPDPELQQQLELLQQKYRRMEQSYQSQISSYQEQLDLQQYQSKRSDVEKYLLEIESLKDQLRRKALELESVTRQSSTRVETKVIYKPDPETQIELEQLRSRYKLLEQQLQSIKDQYSLQIESYQTKIYQYETRKSDSSMHTLEIENLKDQLRRKTLELESYTKKIYLLEQQSKSDAELSKLRFQYDDLRMQYELECQQTKKLRQQLEDLKREYGSLEITINQRGEFKIRELEQLLSQREDRIRQLTNELNQVRSSYELEINQYKTQIQQVRINFDSRELQDLKVQLQKKQEEISLLKAQLEQSEQRYITLQQSYQTIQITMNELKSNDSSEILKCEIKRLQKTIIELRSEIDRLLIQQTDNQWLSKRYEDQQKQIEHYKSQLEQRSTVQQEYTYEIVSNNTKLRPSETNRREVQYVSSEEHKKSINLMEPTQGYSSSSYVQQTVLEPVQKYTINTYAEGGNVARMSETFTQRQEQHAGPTLGVNQRYVTSYYSSQGMNTLNPAQGEDQLKRSRALMDSRAMRWNDDYNEVIDKVVRVEKSTY